MASRWAHDAHCNTIHEAGPEPCPPARETSDRIVGRAYILGTQMDPDEEPPSASLNPAAHLNPPARMAALRLKIADLEGQRDAAMRNWVDAQDAWEATLPVLAAVRAWRDATPGLTPPLDTAVEDGWASAEEVAVVLALEAYDARQETDHA